MIEITDELLVCLRAFEKHFGDIVPLRELPAYVTTEELIEAIKLSIESNKNTLPQKFGYGELEQNPDIII